jgi:hypothetical protein
MRILLRLIAIIYKSKVCYKCKWNLPLFIYKRLKNKHLVNKVHLKGRCYSCNLCVKEHGYVSPRRRRRKKKKL